jgi:hypothetical protein
MKIVKIYIFFFVLMTTKLFSQNFSSGFNFNLSTYDSTEQKYLP